MPSWLIAALARYLGFGLLELLLAFWENLKVARADDQPAIETIDQIVRGLSDAHPDWDGAKKFAYAIDAARVYFVGVGKDVGSSVIRTLVELAVQKLKATQDAGVPPDAARVIGSTGVINGSSTGGA